MQDYALVLELGYKHKSNEFNTVSMYTGGVGGSAIANAFDSRFGH